MLRRIFSALVCLVVATTAPSLADAPPWNHTAITTNTVQVIYSGPVVIAAIQNASTAAQPAGECDIYDNTAASGTIFYAENGIGSGQIVTFGESGNGVLFTNGLTVLCAVAPTGSIQVLWHKV